jgi:hypothetical protein
MTPDRDDHAPSSPYGPQDHIDEAAGGADSSPHEATPADERPAAARAPANAPTPADPAPGPG